RDRARAIDAAGRLAAAMTARRDLLFVDLPKVPAAVDMAVRLARQPGGAPVALIDAADHPGAGAIADTPELLREILRVRPPVPTVCGCFFDPATVARARDAGLGGRIAGTLGARLTSWFGPPVPFEGRVERLSDGRIISTGPVRHGMAVDYGPSAVLDIGGIRVIAISRLQSVFDPAFFDLHAVQLDRLGILAIKAKNQFRAAFTSVFKTMIDVDAPGPAAYDFARLPWKVAPRTIYPLSGR
ncbi:MAG: MlrC family protein 10, partial [Alphaproteobacteria bacterium]|nr:MlrC family protein 10 [Alphaproteobacteria bacterium]